MNELLGHRLCNRRRKRIADLTVGSSFPAGKLPLVGEALQTRDHPHGQARHPSVTLVGRFVGDSDSVHPQTRPCLTRSGWAEIRASVLEAAPNYGGGDLV